MHRNAYKNGLYYGHGELKVYNETHSEWEWRANPDPGAAAIDNVVFTRPPFANG